MLNNSNVSHAASHYAQSGTGDVVSETSSVARVAAKKERVSRTIAHPPAPDRPLQSTSTQARAAPRRQTKQMKKKAKALRNADLGLDVREEATDAVKAKLDANRQQDGLRKQAKKDAEKKRRAEELGVARRRVAIKELMNDIKVTSKRVAERVSSTIAHPPAPDRPLQSTSTQARAAPRRQTKQMKKKAKALRNADLGLDVREEATDAVKAKLDANRQQDGLRKQAKKDAEKKRRAEELGVAMRRVAIKELMHDIEVTSKRVAERVSSTIAHPPAPVRQLHEKATAEEAAKQKTAKLERACRKQETKAAAKKPPVAAKKAHRRVRDREGDCEIMYNVPWEGPDGTSGGIEDQRQHRQDIQHMQHGQHEQFMQYIFFMQHSHHM